VSAATSSQTSQRLKDDLPLLLASWHSAPSLRAALEDVVRCFPLLDEVGRPRLHLDGRRVTVEWRTFSKSRHSSWMMAGGFALLLDVLRSYPAGERVAVSAHWPDDYRPSPYLESLLGGRSSHGVGPGHLQFTVPELDAPYAAFNAPVATLLTRTLQRRLRDLRLDGSTSLQVERALEHVLAHPLERDPGASLVEQVCAGLGASRWTIHRRLAEEGTSLGVLVQAARIREAIRLLEDTRLTVQEIAERLGFASRTSLAHAFHRAVGVSPTGYRDRVVPALPGGR
jgi:AraC-like DNA-binding protein